MDRKIYVYLDLGQKPVLVGKLWSRVRGRNESASFEYDRDWLKMPNNFPLEPSLSLNQGIFHTRENKSIFGAIGDSSPDRWGRTLMRRAERKRAATLKESPRSLFEIDYLLMVDDFSRQGALRFCTEPESAFLADNKNQSVPPLMHLPKLLSASDHLLEENESDEEFKLLLNPGSSLGGARPKASIIDNNGDLLIAKFPHKEDDYDVVTWEALALKLASKAGLNVSNWRIEKIKKRPVLLLNRFDRIKTRRIPFISAMSMLDANDNEAHSYLEIVDIIRQYGAKPKADMQELWKRIVFSVLISNTDDHLRNHGFLFLNTPGWSLAPAYDLNPVPKDIKPRILSTYITENDATASLELVLEVSSYFELNLKEAKKLVKQIAKVTSSWQSEAKSLGINKTSINRFSTAFEHEDLKLGLKLPS